MHRNVCYNNCRQNEMSCPLGKTKPSKSVALRVSFLGCAVQALSIQPLANVVGNYTCSNR